MVISILCYKTETNQNTVHVQNTFVDSRVIIFVFARKSHLSEMRLSLAVQWKFGSLAN